VVLEFVENMIFAAARPEAKEGGLGHDITLRKALHTLLIKFPAYFSGRPLIAARLLNTLGASSWYLSDYKIAEDQYRRAYALYCRSVGLRIQNRLIAPSALLVFVGSGTL